MHIEKYNFAGERNMLLVFQQRLNYRLVLFGFCLSMVLNAPLLLAQKSKSVLELFPVEKTEIFEFQFLASGNEIRLSTFIKPGFGILKDKNSSFVIFSQISPGAEKKIIIRNHFQGKISRNNPLYFESIFAISMPKGKFKKNSKIIAEIQISYCDLKKGICYQEKREVALAI
jgi:hypothetical protein